MSRYDITANGGVQGCVIDRWPGRRRRLAIRLTAAVLTIVVAIGSEVRPLLDRLPLYSTIRTA